MNAFNKCMDQGREGEVAVAAYMASRNHKVEDVSGIKEYWDKDIDFIITSASGNQCSCEVKTDKKIGETCNFYIEESNERETGSYPGWYHYCKADYICFYDSDTGRGYIIDWKAAKPLIKDNANYTAFTNKYDGGVSWGYLLPIGTAKRMGLITHTFTFKMEDY